MNKQIADIIESVNYDISCRGMQGKETATALVKNLFDAENISFDNWEVCEIPLAEVTEGYKTCVVVCVVNHKMKKDISINFDINGNIVDVNPDECCTISVDTIRAAIEHYTSDFSHSYDYDNNGNIIDKRSA